MVDLSMHFINNKLIRITVSTKAIWQAEASLVNNKLMIGRHQYERVKQSLEVQIANFR